MFSSRDCACLEHVSAASATVQRAQGRLTERENGEGCDAYQERHASLDNHLVLFFVQAFEFSLL